MTLHCPATLMVVTPAAAARLDQASLRERRITAVHVAPTPVCEAAALSLAVRLDVPRRRADVGSIDPARSRDAIESIADLHRGETVLVVGPPTLLTALPGLALDRRGAGVGGARTDAAVLECGDDGWELRTA